MRASKPRAKKRTWRGWAVIGGPLMFEPPVFWRKRDAEEDAHGWRMNGKDDARVIRVLITEIPKQPKRAWQKYLKLRAGKPQSEETDCPIHGRIGGSDGFCPKC